MGKLKGVLKVGKLVYQNLDNIQHIIVFLEQLILLGKKVTDNGDGTLTVEGSDKVLHKV